MWSWKVQFRPLLFFSEVSLVCQVWTTVAQNNLTSLLSLKQIRRLLVPQSIIQCFFHKWFCLLCTHPLIFSNVLGHLIFLFSVVFGTPPQLFSVDFKTWCLPSLLLHHGDTRITLQPKDSTTKFSPHNKNEKLQGISSICMHFCFPAFGIQAKKLSSFQKQIIFNAPNFLFLFPFFLFF